MSHMDDPNEPNSVVEDLDPEPPSNSRLPQRLEVLVGVILLIGVLAFVGWQWWHTQVQTSAYAAGETALSTNDWDAALTNFTNAGDYKDAVQQAQRAQGQVDTRNKLYTSAQQHVTNNEWLPALLDVRAAALIQSGYKNLASWEEQALQGVYSDALSGTVALRPNADPPGLYMRSAHTWVYLQNSDRQSTLEATPRNGHLIFDAEVTLGNPGTRQMVSAVLVGDKFEYSPLSFDWVSAVSPDGIWANIYTYLNSGVKDIEKPVIRNSFQGSSEGALVAYEPYTSTDTFTITPPPSFTNTTGNDLVVAIGPQAKYLIAYYTGADTIGVTANTTVNLYMGTVGSATRELIYTHAGGGLQSAQISPDGRYALVTTFRIISPTSEEQSVVLIDLNNLQSPHVVQTAVYTSSLSAGSSILLKSIFVQGGIYAGDILLTQFQGDHTNVMVFDPRKISTAQTAGALITSATVPDTSNKSWFLTKQDAGGVVLAGREDAALPSRKGTQLLGTVTLPEYGVTQTLIAVTMPSSNATQVQSFVKPMTDLLYSFQTSQNRAIWSYSTQKANGDIALAVSSAPVTATVTSNITPTLVYSALDSRGQTANAVSPSVNLGDHLLAYVTPERELHARTYDGAFDLELETGVSFLWDKSSFDSDREMLR